MKKILIAVIMALFMSVGIASAAQVNLAWDPVEGVDGIQYRLYAARYADEYGAPVYSGPATTCTVQIDNAAEYKFVVRAFLVGDSGATYESPDSNEVLHAIVLWESANLRLQ